MDLYSDQDKKEITELEEGFVKVYEGTIGDFQHAIILIRDRNDGSLECRVFDNKYSPVQVAVEDLLSAFASELYRLTNHDSFNFTTTIN